MKSKLIIFLILLSVFVKGQTIFLLDEFEYSTDALASAAYVPSESYIEILTHAMTSNTAPSPYISVASTELSSTYGAYKAFDYDEAGGDATYWCANTSTGTLRQYTSTYFIPSSYVVESSSANASTYAPKNWTFECSTDGTNWTTCGTETNQTGWSNSEQRSYNCTNVQGQYRYFRLNITANNTGTYVAVGEFYVTGGDDFVWKESTTKKQGSYSIRITHTNNASGNTYTRTAGGSVPTVNLTGCLFIHFHVLSATYAGVVLSVGLHDVGGTTTGYSFSVAATNTWTNVNFNLSGVSDANKDAIDKIIITIPTSNANTFYIDNFFIKQNVRAIEKEQIYNSTSNKIGGN
jgi:hypothetical protein